MAPCWQKSLLGRLQGLIGLGAFTNRRYILVDILNCPMPVVIIVFLIHNFLPRLFIM